MATGRDKLPRPKAAVYLYCSQIIMGESNEGGLILPAFFALAFENELEYHYLCAH